MDADEQRRQISDSKLKLSPLPFTFYMVEWDRAAARKKANCAVVHYSTFLDNTFEKNYIKNDNGVEGIRLDGDFRCPGGVERVSAPASDMSTTKKDGTWH